MPFNIFRDLGVGAMNPPIDTKFAAERVRSLMTTGVFPDKVRILCSPAQRCIETAQLIASSLGMERSAVEVEPLLSEVHFDLSELNRDGLVESALKAGDMRVVNTVVFKGIIKGTGAEKASLVQARVEKLFKKMANKPESLLCISHDFFMRFLELRIHSKALVSPAISAKDLSATQRNGYLCGFQTNGSFTQFEYLGE